MDLIRRHKAKLAFLCLIIGMISLGRSFYTHCFDADGVAQSCTEPTRPIAHMGGGVDPIDAGLGVVLVLAAPIALSTIRRPF